MNKMKRKEYEGYIHLIHPCPFIFANIQGTRCQFSQECARSLEKMDAQAVENCAKYQTMNEGRQRIKAQLINLMRVPEDQWIEPSTQNFYLN